jgi:hypothetical protein
MIRNRSQRFWDIYQGYLLSFEQGARSISNPRKISGSANLVSFSRSPP